MNEHVKQCWDQAVNNDDSWDGHIKFMEKFAELIVEESIKQCWSVSELEHNGYVVSECSKRVRKHFGFEV